MSSTEKDVVLPLSASAAGRVSGKPWKSQRSTTKRVHPTDGVNSKSWQERITQSKKISAVKQLEVELREEKQAELTRRRQVTQERKKALEEKRRLEEEKAKMGAKRASRMRRKAGRTAKINH